MKSGVTAYLWLLASVTCFFTGMFKHDLVFIGGSIAAALIGDLSDTLWYKPEDQIQIEQKPVDIQIPHYLSNEPPPA